MSYQFEYHKFRAVGSNNDRCGHYFEGDVLDPRSYCNERFEDGPHTFVCSCGARGFEPSVKVKDSCTFCDGTDAGAQ